MLLSFVNNDLFPALPNLAISKSTSQGQAIVRYAFESAHNYVQDRILLRRVLCCHNSEFALTALCQELRSLDGSAEAHPA